MSSLQCGNLGHDTRHSRPCSCPSHQLWKEAARHSYVLCCTIFFPQPAPRLDLRGQDQGWTPDARHRISSLARKLCWHRWNRWWWWPVNFPFWNLNWEVSTQRFSAVGSGAISKHRHRVGLRLMASKRWGSRPAENGKEAHYLWCISFYLGKVPQLGYLFYRWRVFGLSIFIYYKLCCCKHSISFGKHTYGLIWETQISLQY